MKTINTFIKAVVEIAIIALVLVVIGGLGYVLYASNVLENPANLVTYLNGISMDALPLNLLAFVVIGAAIGMYLLKPGEDYDDSRPVMLD